MRASFFVSICTRSAGPRPLVTARQGRRSERRQVAQNPARASTRDTVARDTRSCAAMCAIVQRRRRSVTIRCAVPLAMACGEWWRTRAAVKQPRFTLGLIAAAPICAPICGRARRCASRPR